MRARNIGEIMHHWAHQVKERGRVGNVSYEGPVLYSYALPIARLAGNGVVVITTNHYSPTTSRHIAWAASASHHLRRVHAWYADNNGDDANRNYWEREVVNALKELDAFPRRKKTLSKRIDEILSERAEYVKAFNLDWPELSAEAIRKEHSEEIQKGVESWHRTEAERRENERRWKAQQEAERLEAQRSEADALAAWQAGVNVKRRFATTALRVVGDEIETSHGAFVPLEAARKLWPVLKALKEAGNWKTFHGTRLGHYPVEQFTLDGTLIVGCHRIPWSEIEGIAEHLEVELEEEKLCA
jgi:hypothetical protein